MNKESFKKRGGHYAIVAFAFIAAFLLGVTQIAPSPKLVTDEEGFSYITWDSNVVSATEATPTAGASSVLELFFVNHSAVPTTAYVTNTSSKFETWANASLDPDGAGATYKAYTVDVLDGTFTTLTVKWGTDMDLVVRYRGNRTHCYDGSKFIAPSCRVKLNATGCSNVASSQVMAQAISHNVSTDTYIWINAYYNLGTIAKGGTCTITNIKLEFNY